MKLNKLIGIYNEQNHKVFNFFGLKIKKTIMHKYLQNEIKQMEGRLLNNFARLQTISLLHQKTFPEYKNKYQNKAVVLVGAGPTLNHFVPIKNAVYVGLNRTFLFERINFDYLFTIDKVGIDMYYKEFAEYKGNNCIKFIGDQNLGKNFQIPESYINKLENIKRYKTTAGFMGNKIALNLESEPLANFCTVSLQAMQFILYTNPAKVYIVGIDCNMTKAGHFFGASYDNSKRNENSQQNDDNSILYWKRLKNFAECYYPETEIISVNPVGLRGLFKDVYTESYLLEHPEIREELGASIVFLDSKEAINV